MFASASARHRARPKLARRLAVLGAALILGGVSVGIVSTSATAATTAVSTYGSETFTNATASGVLMPSVPDNGSTKMTNSACLTAASGTTAANGSALPGCATNAVDTAGNGALRLTGASQDKEGGVGSTTAVPTGQGLDVTFNSYQYGGSRADGIVFYLAATDPYDPQVPTAIGAKGGSLGYSASYYSDTTNGTAGLKKGYLGFGLDAFGNFRSGTYQGKDCTAQNAAQPSVSVRGPGDGVNGYCLLTPDTNTSTVTTASDLSAGSPVANLARTSTQYPSKVPVEVVVNPSNTAVQSSGFSGSLTTQTVAAMHWAIIFKPLGKTATQIVSGALPSLKSTTATGAAAAVNSDWYDQSTGLPYKLSYGWVASTGGSTDIHEINQFTATSVTGQAPVLAATAKVDDTTPQRNASGVYTVTPSTSSNGGSELGSVRVTTTFDAGATPKSGTFTAGPNGEYTCSTSGQVVTCTTPAALSVAAGNALPAIAIPYTGTAGIGTKVNVTSTVASTDALATASTSAAFTVAKVPTSTVVSASTTTPTAGDQVTLTATVVKNGSAATSDVYGGSTGTMTFQDNGTTITGPATVTNGVATLTYTVPSKGSHTFTASYSGDATYGTSNGSTSVNATAKSTAFTVVLNPSQVQYGDSSTVTASGLQNGATGTVTFSTTSASGTAAFCRNVPVATATTTGCATPAWFDIGSYTISAQYSGDGVYSPSSATNAPVLVVTKVATTPTVTLDGGSSAAVTYGTAVTLGTTGLPQGATGTVTYTVDGTPGSPVALGATSSSSPTLSVGTHQVTVTYSGDATYAGSTSAARTITVSKATTPITVTPSNPNPSHGDTETLSTGGLPAGATGTVTFTDGTTELCTATITNGAASCTVTPALSTGDHTITAHWDGDANHDATTSAPVTLTVAKAAVTIGTSVQDVADATVSYGETASFRATGLPADADPSSVVTFVDGAGKQVATATAGDPTYTTPDSQPVGDLTLTAKWAGDADHTSTTVSSATLHVTKAAVTITQTADGAALSTITHGKTAQLATVGLPADADGTVTYTAVDGDGKSWSLGTGDASTSGAPVTTEKLPAGDYTITAAYSGDAHYAAATAADVRLVVTQAKPDLTGTVNGSDTSATTTYGTPAKLDVRGLADDATGTVTFTAGTGADTVELCTVDLADGTSCQTAADLPAGEYDVTATYSGDHDNAPNATTTTVALTVEKATAPITATTSDPAPTYGQPITLTAGGLPTGATGKVIFTDSDGTELCTADLHDGTATCTIDTPLGAGDHQVTATWDGDHDHAKVTSDAVDIDVAKASVTIGGTVDGKSSDTVEYGTGATIAATGLPEDAVADSVVTFTDGDGATIGTTTAGSPTVTVPKDQAVGTLTVTAHWAGDANHTPADAAPVTLTVTPATVSLTETVDRTDQQTITYGDTATLEAWGLPKSATGDVSYTAVDANDVTHHWGTGDAADEGAPMTTSKRLPMGDYTVTAAYAGDANHKAAVAPTVRLLVAKAKPTLTIATADPSTPFGTGTTVTIGGLPTDGTGQVVVTAVRGDETTVLCTIDVPSATGTETCTTPDTLGAGKYTLSATYTGDANHEVDTTATPADLEVTKAATTVGVGGTGTGSNGTGGNGTGGNGTDGTGTGDGTVTAPYGTPITLTPTGLPEGGTGTVEFQDGDGTTLCTVTLGTDTSCTTPTDLPVGSHTVTPVYSGDDDHAGSTGTPVTITVTQAPTAVTVAAGPSQVWGSATTLTIGGLPATATGSVELSVDGVTICSIPLPQTSCTTDAIEPGTVVVTAAYAGDRTYLGSSATTPVTVTAMHTVNPTHVLSPSLTAFPAVWPAVTGAVSYEIVVASDQAFTQDVHTITVTAPATTVTIDGLTSGTTYWYRVTATSATRTVLSTHDAVAVTAALVAAAPAPTTPAAADPAPVVHVGELAFTGPTVAVGMVGFGALLLLFAGVLLLIARRLRREPEQGPGPLRRG